MKILWQCFYAILVTALLLTTAHASDTDKIIDKYKKAVGGNAVKKIKSTSMSGSVEITRTQQPALIGHFTYQQVAPDNYRLDIEAPGFKLREAYNGNSGWRENDKELLSFIGDDLKQLRIHAILLNTHLNELSKSRITPQNIEKKQLDNAAMNVVDLVFGNSSIKCYFSSANGLLMKEEWQKDNQLLEIFYRDYRKVDGVMEPFAITRKDNNGEYNIKIEQVTHNRNIEEAIFRFPKVDDRPLPDITALMQKVEANQEKLEEIRQLYIYRETQISNELDGDGKIKKTETNIYEVTPYEGQRVRRLISTDGKELVGSEKEKQDKEVKKQTEEIKKEKEKQDKKKQKEQKDKEKGKNKKDDDDDDDLTLLDFLRIIEVSNAHREQFRGHEVIAFDFEPRKNFKPKNRVESIISKLSGSFVVDEDAQQVVRLEARLTDSFKIGGGLLASVSPSTAFSFEQEKIREEIWLPSYTEVNFGGKALLFVKFNGFTTTRFSDYRRYQTDVEIKSVDEKE